MSDWIEKVHAFADGQLTEAEKAEVVKLIGEDKTAQAEYEWARYTKEMLATKCQPIADDESWQACLNRLDAIDKTSKAEGFVGRYAWAMCALFLIAICSAAWVNRTYGSKQLSNEQVAGLFSSFSPVVERSSAQNQSPKEIVQQCIPNPPVLVIPPQFVVESAEKTETPDFAAARLLIHDEKGQLALVIINNASGVEAIDKSAGNEFQSGTLNSNPCVLWESNGSTILLMGPRSREELLQIADVMKHSTPH